MWETWVQSLPWKDPLEKGTANSLQYRGLENSMDCIVHGVTQSQAGLSDQPLLLDASCGVLLLLLLLSRFSPVRLCAIS